MSRRVPLRQWLSASNLRPSSRKKRTSRSFPQVVDVLEVRTLLSATVGNYDEDAEQPNGVDLIALGSSLNANDFAAGVATAFSSNLGGVIDATSLSISGYDYGVSQSKSLNLVRADGTNYGIGGTAFNTSVESISGTGAFVSSSSGGFHYTSFDFEVNGTVDEHVVELGVTVLSYTGRDYGIVSVNGRLASGSTKSAFRIIDEPEAAGDTFFGLTAPDGDYFTGFSIEYDSGINSSLWFDDIGFRTHVFSSEPPAPITLDPIATASIEDSDRNGTGDAFNSPPFTGLLSQSINQEDRAVAEFNLSQFTSVSSAVLDLELGVNNSLGGGVRTFDVFTYAGNGQGDLSDFTTTGTKVGTIELVVSEGRGTYQLDVTAAIQNVMAQQSQFTGVRVDPVNDSAPSVLTTSTLTVVGNPVVSNQPPEIAAQGFQIAEHSAVGTVIGRVAAFEPDAQQSLSFQITSGNALGLFSIDEETGDLSVVNSLGLDFESAARHVLTVAVTDDGTPALTTAASMTIDVVDINDLPPSIVPNQEFHVAEDAANGSVIGTVVATDRDTVGMLQGFSIVSGNSAGLFAIDSATGQITVANTALLDHDAQPTHALGVQVSDGVHQSAVETVTIAVDPLPPYTELDALFRASIHDAPTDGIGDLFNDSPFEGLLRQQTGRREDRAVAEFDLNELGAVTGGRLDFRLSVNNSFGDEDRHYNLYLYAGNGQADLADYSQSGILAGSAVLPNFGGIDYSLDVSTALASLVAQGTRYIGVRVDPVNDSAPSIFGPPTLIVNAGPTLDNILDPAPVAEDSGTHSIQLTGISAGGREEQMLVVTAATDNTSLITDLSVVYESPNSTGVLSYQTGPNEFGSGEVTVTVTDAGVDGVLGNADDSSISRTFNVVVTSVNDIPELADGQVLSVEEHAADGTHVGDITATDVENDPLTFEIISGNEESGFAINAQTGRIIVADASQLDFELRSQFDLVIRVAESADPSQQDTALVTIHLVDLVEPSIVAEPDDGVVDIKKGGRVSIAILSTELFDATTEIDVSNLTLEIGGALLLPESHRKKGFRVERRDVNGDGIDDLVVSFDVGDAQLTAGEAVPITLRGFLADGREFSSHGFVDVVEGRKGGGKGRRQKG